MSPPPLATAIQSLQREIASLRWMIGVGFTPLSIFLAISTFIRSSGSGYRFMTERLWERL